MSLSSEKHQLRTNQIFIYQLWWYPNSSRVINIIKKSTSPTTHAIFGYPLKSQGIISHIPQFVDHSLKLGSMKVNHEHQPDWTIASIDRLSLIIQSFEDFNHSYQPSTSTIDINHWYQPLISIDGVTIHWWIALPGCPRSLDRVVQGSVAASGLEVGLGSSKMGGAMDMADGQNLENMWKIGGKIW